MYAYVVSFHPNVTCIIVCFKTMYANNVDVTIETVVETQSVEIASASRSTSKTEQHSAVGGHWVGV